MAVAKLRLEAARGVVLQTVARKVIVVLGLPCDARLREIFVPVAVDRGRFARGGEGVAGLADVNAIDVVPVGRVVVEQVTRIDTLGPDLSLSAIRLRLCRLRPRRETT